MKIISEKNAWAISEMKTFIEQCRPYLGHYGKRSAVEPTATVKSAMFYSPYAIRILLLNRSHSTDQVLDYGFYIANRVVFYVVRLLSRTEVKHIIGQL
jgi:hypothetical protein